METTKTSTDIFDAPPQELPSSLKILTTLTFIGCALSYISSIWNAFKSTPAYYQEQRDQIQEQMDKVDANSTAGQMMQGSLEMMEKGYANRHILLISGLIFTTFCLIGAIQMRQLKKSGYPIYVIGELSPILITAIFLGFTGMAGFMLGFVALVSIIFVILYTRQRKYLYR